MPSRRSFLVGSLSATLLAAAARPANASGEFWLVSFYDGKSGQVVRFTNPANLTLGDVVFDDPTPVVAIAATQAGFWFALSGFGDATELRFSANGSDLDSTPIRFVVPGTVTALCAAFDGLYIATFDRREGAITFNSDPTSPTPGKELHRDKFVITAMTPYRDGLLTAFSNSGNGHRIWFSEHDQDPGTGSLRYEGSSPVRALAAFQDGVLVGLTNAGGLGERIWFSADGFGLGAGELVYDGSSPVGGLLPINNEAVLTSLSRAGKFGNRIHLDTERTQLGRGKIAYEGGAAVLAMAQTIFK